MVNTVKLHYRRKGGLLLLYVFLSLFIFSCQKELKPTEFFPLRDGAVYIYNDGLSRREVNFFAQKGKYELYTISNFVNDTSYIMQDEYIKSEHGVYWYGFQAADFGKIYFNPPLNLIPRISDQDTTLVSVVKEHRESESTSETYTLRVELHYLGQEQLSLPAGEFETVHYRYLIKYLGKKPDESLMDFSGDWWFAKNVGLVKQVAAEMTLQLTDYKIP